MIASGEAQDAASFWALVLGALGLCAAAGWAATHLQPEHLLIAAAGLAIALVGFASPKLGLVLVIFSMIFSPRLEVGSLSGNRAVVFKINDFLLVILFFAWMTRRAFAKEREFFVSTPVNVPIVVLSAVFVVSTLLGVLRGDLEPLKPMFYILKYIEYYLLFFMTVGIADNRGEAKKYLRHIWIAALLVTLYAYGEIHSGQRISAPFDTPIGHEGEVNEPNTFGGYYIVIMGVLLSFFTQGDATLSPIALGSFLFMIPPFLLTLSRSSYMGFLMAALFHAVATPTRRWAVVAGMMLGSILVMSVPTLRQAVFKRVEYTVSYQGVGSGKVDIAGSKVELEGSAFARVQSWGFILRERFPDHPLLGRGVTGVGLVDAYFPLVIGETGALGLCCFLWLMATIWRCCWKVLRASNLPFERALALGVATAMVGLFVQSLAANTFIIVRIMEPFWFAVALLARAYVEVKREHGAAAEWD